MRNQRPILWACVLTVLLAASQATALDQLIFRTPGATEELRDTLTDASLLRRARSEDRTAPRDVFAAALGDYRQLLETLYADGRYSGTISIRIDGREAADIALLAIPQRIGTVEVVVNPGPIFRFGRAEIAPLAANTVLPDSFATGRRARAPVVGEAAEAAIGAWRDAGHAKARLAEERVTANHAARRLDVSLGLDPGPRLRFGELRVTSGSAVRDSALRRIAGLPTGEVFSPEEAKTSADRLRRTGTFAAVQLTEAETPNADGTLDMLLAVTDRRPRRFGFGAEISSLEGLTLSAFWLHRNLLGGAERLRIEGEVRNIEGDTSGIDYIASARLDVPAVVGPDTDGFARAEYAALDEPTFRSDRIELGVGLNRRLSDTLTAEIELTYLFADVDDALGRREFSLITLPSALTWDLRDSELDPRAGWYLRAEGRPFLSLDGVDANGARLYGDLRGYTAFGESDGTVLAGRLQVGSVVGADLGDVPPEFLFTSGGGGTVRGQPYKSLDVPFDGDRTGGRGFIGLSAELRQDLTDSLQLVAFADAGFIGADPGYEEATGDWHSGAGLGLRYQTGIGPIRLDIAGPTGGDTGDGVQFYIGIGQAF